MKIKLLKALCLLGLHRPSVARTKRIGTDYVSACRACEKKMVKKRFAKTWRISSQPHVEPPMRKSARSRR